MIGYGNSVFLRTALGGGGGGVDPDAQAFITAAAITDPTQQAAINTLVVDLKGYNIWTKFSGLYPFVGGTASTHKFNLKNPLDTNAAFRLLFNGGGTHSVNGYKGNGMNSFADTNFTPSTSGILNSHHISYYSRTNVSEVVSDMGVVTNSDANGTLLVIGRSLTTAFYRNNSGATYSSFSDTTSRGLMIVNRTASNVLNAWRDGVKKSTVSTASSGLPTAPVYIGSWNINGNSASSNSKECAFASIGDGLLDSEANNLYLCVQQFNTTLGRQV
jgi:hypothetical protein